MRFLLRLIVITAALTRKVFSHRSKTDSPKRIILVHRFLLGDTILMAPLMKRISEVFPQTIKLVLCTRSQLPLFEGHPYDFKPVPYDPKRFEDLKALWKLGKFDIAYVLGDNRYSWLAMALRSKWICGFAEDRPVWKNWMIDESVPFENAETTWADMAARLVDGKNPSLFGDGEWSEPCTMPLRHGLPPAQTYVLCHLGASSRLKFWPASNWALVISALASRGLKAVLTVGPHEHVLLEEVDPQRQHFHVAGDASLREMWQLVRDARILISPDTGIAHLGKLTGTPTICLFGPGSVEIHGKGEFWKNSEFHGLTVRPFACRDQKILFRRRVEWVERCGRSEQQCQTPGACMAAITPEMVLDAITSLLDK